MQLDEKEVNSFLTATRNAVGELKPVLKSVDGRIIDGFRRNSINWQSELVLKQIDSPLKYLVARLATNSQRRIPSDEMKSLITNIADELVRSGVAEFRENENSADPLLQGQGRYVVVQLIEQLTGLHRNTITKYLPLKYKFDHPSLKEQREKVQKSYDAHGSKRRSRIEMHLDMLDKILVAEQQGLLGVKKTQMMYHSGVSHTSLQDIMNRLIAQGLIVYDGKYMTITGEGRLVHLLWSYILSKINHTDKDLTPQMKIVQNIIQRANIMGE
ncbi:MAG: winged helix-turn-helix domain-containing protein [Planctomycetota bacterium]|jgi:predicted transcriptional regulator